MSLRLRLIIATLSLVALSIIVLGVISVNIAANRASEALTESAKQKLISQSAQSREAVEEYFHIIESQLRVQSFSLSTIEAAREFIPAFNQYHSQRGNINSTEISKTEEFYDKDFV
ncbi:hypothetical protein [Aliiglaciecola sp. LCG003]|uniref:hypothetical protein n=1 Tax=Aliiglaciecola sp. LCG003 TaxID=3053655 RepID=UPI0025726676|nr:hypothetical protein [Aliiglaciecola sp. LCG003]WJG08135.1 hypothetical protein QR722_12370 [Aliiglaciecola sp. LCG003]